MGQAADQAIYPLRAVIRMTGLSDHVLRAWEHRYGAVLPLRSPGGSRRYRESDVARLRLLRAGVDAGYSIGELALLSDAALKERLGLPVFVPDVPLAPLLEAMHRLDGAALDYHLGFYLAALGARRFTAAIVVPRMREIGERWRRGDLLMACEHLTTAILRGLLGAALHPNVTSPQTQPILFTTPADERHEIGCLVAAITAREAGRSVAYLGPDLPATEIADAAMVMNASTVVFSIVAVAPASAKRTVSLVRRRLPPAVGLWIGGPQRDVVAEVPGIAILADLAALESALAQSAAR